MSGFSTLNTAISGLTAAQRALDITGQNVVNANTPGYSRQVVRTSSAGVTTAATFHTGTKEGLVGGVLIDDVQRIRDSFLEGTRVVAGAVYEALNAQAATLKGVEQLLSEPGDGGLQSVLDDFYAAWHDLSVRPNDEGAGAVAIQRGNAVVAQLKFMSTGTSERWDTARDDLKSTVAELNQAAADLAKVNAKIREGVIAERPVNELLDRRDTLVRTLGDLAGGRAVDAGDGMVSVTINGISLVAGAHSVAFALSGATALAAATADPPLVTLGTIPVAIESGRAAGLLAAMRTDLPSVSTQLDAVAVAFRDVVNIVHSSGFTLGGATGLDFFSGTGANNLSVAVNSTAELAVASAAGVVDGGNALKLADLAIDINAETVLGPGNTSPSARWRHLAANVGTQVQGLQRATEVQKTVVSTADAAVESDAGVNLDEEMASLLMFQRSYQAAARVITAVDEMLDTLVNRLGTVGR